MRGCTRSNQLNPVVWKYLKDNALSKLYKENNDEFKFLFDIYSMQIYGEIIDDIEDAKISKKMMTFYDRAYM